MSPNKVVVNRCVTETVWPATISDPTRSVAVALTETLKEAGPLPALPAAAAMKFSAVDSVHAQPHAALAVTVTLAFCADASGENSGGRYRK